MHSCLCYNYVCTYNLIDYYIWCIDSQRTGYKLRLLCYWSYTIYVVSYLRVKWWIICIFILCILTMQEYFVCNVKLLLSMYHCSYCDHTINAHWPQLIKLCDTGSWSTVLSLKIMYSVLNFFLFNCRYMWYLLPKQSIAFMRSKRPQAIGWRLMNTRLKPISARRSYVCVMQNIPSKQPNTSSYVWAMKTPV